MFSRRRFLQYGVACSALNPTRIAAATTIESVRSRLPSDLPAGIAAIIAKSLDRTPSSINTDWFGSLLMQGLLQWARRGISEIRPFALAWLDYHWNSKGVSPYSGPASRIFLAGRIPITTYAGHYSLAFPCFEMVNLYGEPRARQICLDVARTILHRASRNRLGMVNHDDHADFAIPDTCYFVVVPLMMASVLNQGNSQAFQEQAVIQLRTYVDAFLMKETGLVRTILLKEGLGKTLWTRASGWLLWAIVGVLRYLPRSIPEREGFLKDLRCLADGLRRVQHASGGFRVLLDEPSTPLETTGTIMVAVGLQESMRQGWLPESFQDMVSLAWQFAKSRISDDGRVLQAYTGWAVPAEQYIMSMDEHEMEWIPGFVLSAADILSREAPASGSKSP